MKERPILFSAPMVRALLAGTKTQTRRLFKMPKWAHPDDKGEDIEGDCPAVCNRYSGRLAKVETFGRIGDRLWVKETFKENEPPSGYIYRASDAEYGYTYEKPWKPSIFMPRKASRITLEITGVRVERLNDISEEDAWAEGIGRTGYTPEEFVRNQAGDRSVLIASFRDDLCYHNYPTAKEAYAGLWESINGPGSWDLNPWVWVIEFRKL